jgi:hypothetical protein
VKSNKATTVNRGIRVITRVHTTRDVVLGWRGTEGTFVMAAPHAPVSLSLEQILEAIDRLTPAKMREIERRMAARRSDRVSEGSNDETLVRAASARLPASAERRLKRLVARSESRRLTQNELAEYQALALRAQQLDAARAEALAKLARKRGKSARVVKADIGSAGSTNGI